MSCSASAIPVPLLVLYKHYWRGINCLWSSTWNPFFPGHELEKMCLIPKCTGRRKLTLARWQGQHTYCQKKKKHKRTWDQKWEKYRNDTTGEFGMRSEKFIGRSAKIKQLLRKKSVSSRMSCITPPNNNRWWKKTSKYVNRQNRTLVWFNRNNIRIIVSQSI